MDIYDEWYNEWYKNVYGTPADKPPAPRTYMETSPSYSCIYVLSIFVLTLLMVIIFGLLKKRI